MPIIALFFASFAVAFLVYRKRGEKVADCIHKGLVAGIVISVTVFGIVTAVSYI